MAHASGKYSNAISDRSGMEFPYKEMVKEWNGSMVHKSEFEAKHPQLERQRHAVVLMQTHYISLSVSSVRHVTLKKAEA